MSAPTERPRCGVSKRVAAADYLEASCDLAPLHLGDHWDAMLEVGWPQDRAPTASDDWDGEWNDMGYKL